MANHWGTSTDNRAQQEIENLLSDRIGLKAGALSSSSIAKTVQWVAAAAGFSNTATYLKYLRTSPTAIEALIEAIVVPETSFFRNPESFAYLHQHISSQTLLSLSSPPAHQPTDALKANEFKADSLKKGHFKKKAHAPEQFWKVMSIPCSTGEEPYSISIALQEAGLSKQQFKIDAVDISATAIAKAQQGKYQSYSFRKTASYSPDKHIEKYFQKQTDGYQLSQQVRSPVHFHQANLAEANCLSGYGPYDIIFCRNLLIYFHQKARQQALQTIDHCLRPGGLLFIGYAETSQIDLARFEPILEPQVFAYRKRKRQSPSAPPLATATEITALPDSSPLAGASLANDSPETSLMSITSPESASQRAGATSPANWLSESRTLADSGQIEAAKILCDRYLENHPASAAAYLLLGEIYQAQNNYIHAEIALKKALYLNPNCAEALRYRILILEKKGEHASAHQVRARLRRLTNEKKPDAPPC